MSKIFIFSGDFGSGKTVEALSFVPNRKIKGPVIRWVVDSEIRDATYQSPDGEDHPEKLQFIYKPINTSRLTGELFFDLMKAVHAGKDLPHVVIIDDTAMLQEIMESWWGIKENLVKTAALYDRHHRCLTETTWKPVDPGTIYFKKKMFVEFMLDLKQAEVDLIITSPLHNIWENYGKRGYGADGLPFMRILGQSANVQDCWQQMADVIWQFTRKDGKKTLAAPKVSMDLFIEKAALPGVQEQFEWPGWKEIWRWHNDRTYVADMTKLKRPEPTVDNDAVVNSIKRQIVKDLDGKVTLANIKAAMEDSLAPEITSTNKEDVEKFIVRWVEKK